jgi:hypothetical protein
MARGSRGGRGPGRPRSPLDARLYLRASLSQLQIWEEKAEEMGFGRSLSSWIRHVCDKAAAAK